MNDSRRTPNKQTILIVDDTPENIDVLTEVLDPYYQTKVALNGERALKIMAGETKPDLILLDIMMPGISGYDVCRRLKRTWCPDFLFDRHERNGGRTEGS